MTAEAVRVPGVPEHQTRGVLNFLQAHGVPGILQRYGTQRPLTAQERARLRTAAVLPLPRGWSVDRVYCTDLRVTLVEAGSTPMVERLPVTNAMLSRGSETLELELVATRSRVARRWVRHAVVGEWSPMRLGRAFVRGPSFAIDLRSHVLRGMYHPGAPIVTGIGEDERMAELEERTRALMLEHRRPAPRRVKRRRRIARGARTG